MSWHHAPPHHFTFGDTFFITAATDHKQDFYRAPAALDELHELLFANAEKHHCSLQSWCLLSNHYHLVVRGNGAAVRQMLARFHTEAAIACNQRDALKGRRVWYQFWDKTLTIEGSWLARLRYTNENAVHHGLVNDARKYKWCSAAWFDEAGPAAFARAVASVRTDRVKVYDEY
jgi:REP element-mobilizing transposase RayT